jgi:hypothetical protein
MRLPEHKCGLYLEHNAHIDNHQSVKDWLSYCEYESEWWESPEHRQRAIDNDDVWTLQWYPETPVGSIHVAAPTLEELLDWANRNT